MTKPGTYRGKHYTDWVDEVKRRKKAGDLEGALEILSGCMAATIEEDHRQGRAPAPWYFEQAAIIHRKLKDYASEVTVLETYEASCPPGAGGRLAPRLRKARELAAKAATVPACPSCGVVLETTPAKRADCPHCAEPIVVRRKEGQVDLRTVEQDEQVKRDAPEANADEQNLTRANALGITDAEFEARRGQLSEQFGHRASTADTYWSLATEVARSAGMAGQHAREHSTRLAMAEFLHQEGRAWSEQATLAVAANLRSLGWADLDNAAEIVGCDCGPCIADRPQATYGEMTQTPPIPHPDCEKPPCRCRVQLHRAEIDRTATMEFNIVVQPAEQGSTKKRWWRR